MQQGNASSRGAGDQAGGMLRLLSCSTERELSDFTQAVSGPDQQSAARPLPPEVLLSASRRTLAENHENADPMLLNSFGAGGGNYREEGCPGGGDMLSSPADRDEIFRCSRVDHPCGLTRTRIVQYPYGWA